jgi:hypothetical protein
MGTSTDGYLFYGYAFSEKLLITRTKTELVDGDSHGDEEDDENYIAWDDLYAERKGLDMPDVGDTDWTNDAQVAARYDVLKPYWDAQRALLQESGCKLDTYCANAYQMSLVAISDSFLCASRGDAIEVKSLEVKENWDALLQDFCKTLNIDTTQAKDGAPKWWLVSYWG